MRKKILILNILFCFTAYGKEIYYGSSPELVKISKETIFRFHKQVRTISQAQRFDIGPADESDPDYSVLSVRPRFTKGTSKVAFVLSDGSVATLKLKIVKSKDHDEPFYDIKPKSLLIERSEKNLPVITVMDFIKSIDRGDNVVGYKTTSHSSYINTGRIQGVKAKLIKTYTGKEYKGYVIELRNRYRTKSYRVDVSQLKFKDSGLAIISLIDTKILTPKGKGTHKTLLKVVAKPSSSIKDIILPIYVKTKKQGDKQ